MLPPKSLLSNSAFGILLIGAILFFSLQAPWHLSGFMISFSVAFLLFSLFAYRPLIFFTRRIPAAYLPYFSGAVAGSAWLILSATSLIFVSLFPALGDFQHIFSTPPSAIIGALGLPIIGMGLWLISLRFLENNTHYSLPKWMLGALLPALVASFWLPMISVWIGSLVWLLLFRIYLITDRSSLTWLVGWLLLIVANSAYSMSVMGPWRSKAMLVFFGCLFLSTFFFSLLFRGLMSLGKVSLQSYNIPLGGIMSLRLKIQLAFFGITILAFVLIVSFSLIYSPSNPNSNFSPEGVEQFLAAYTFLLLAAGSLGLALANSITNPLVQINQHLERTKLSKNEPIEWNNRRDEVGLIVKNYNQMIADLEKSAQQLAEQERESAWREMAQQVAHEIKNPLTPMRLHLQQLVRLHKEDPDRALAWSKNTAQVLLEQIEVLNRIASEFSHFAKLPKVNLQSFPLSEVISEVHALFSKNEVGADVQLEMPSEQMWINADRDHLSRILINLLRNAMQAVPTDGTGLIKVKLSRDHKEALLQIEDNGPGIPEDIQHQIFQPKFTTKSSGTGLGLAMCKNMIERMNGRIWFVSQAQAYTIFKVSLPLLPPIEEESTMVISQTSEKSFS